jgi:hypothetical protein
MAFGDDAVVEPLDGIGREEGDVVAEASPVEGGGLFPAADPMMSRKERCYSARFWSRS